MNKEEIMLEESTSNINEMPKIKTLSEMSFEELKTICNDRNIIMTKQDNSKKALIKLINASEAHVITEDNKVVSPVITANQVEQIPRGFVNMEEQNKKKINELHSHNGRIYKVLPGGYGMYTDNGSSFPLSSIM